MKEMSTIACPMEALTIGYKLTLSLHVFEIPEFDERTKKL